jgi:hypothetical protein
MSNLTPAPTDPRAARLQELLGRLQPQAADILARMAERLLDLPDDQAFGQVEYDLRDLAHELAAAVHRTGLEAGKKRGTSVPAPPAPTARPTPASSSTAPRPG